MSIVRIDYTERRFFRPDDKKPAFENALPQFAGNWRHESKILAV